MKAGTLRQPCYQEIQLVPRWNGKKFFKKLAFDQLGLDPMLAVRILKFVDLFFVF